MRIFFAGVLWAKAADRERKACSAGGVIARDGTVRFFQKWQATMKAQCILVTVMKVPRFGRVG